jgi:hypothetical protein
LFVAVMLASIALLDGSMDRALRRTLKSNSSLNDEDCARPRLGYDHNFVLNGAAGKLRTVARLHSPQVGALFESPTTEPGLQFYTGHFLNSQQRGKALGGREDTLDFASRDDTSRIHLIIQVFLRQNSDRAMWDAALPSLNLQLINDETSHFPMRHIPVSRQLSV